MHDFFVKHIPAPLRYIHNLFVNATISATTSASGASAALVSTMSSPHIGPMSLRKWATACSVQALVSSVLVSTLEQKSNHNLIILISANAALPHHHPTIGEKVIDIVTHTLPINVLTSSTAPLSSGPIPHVLSPVPFPPPLVRIPNPFHHHHEGPLDPFHPRKCDKIRIIYRISLGRFFPI